MPRVSSRSLRAVLGAALVAACSTPTDVNPATIVLHEVTLRTAEEWRAWPGSPEIEGGQTVRVRGTAFTGCADASAHVRRRGDVVGIEITAINTQRICNAAVAMWEPFDATVSGLPPGSYRVRVAAAGLRTIAEARVVVQ